MLFTEDDDENLGQHIKKWSWDGNCFWILNVFVLLVSIFQWFHLIFLLSPKLLCLKSSNFEQFLWIFEQKMFKIFPNSLKFDSILTLKINHISPSKSINFDLTPHIGKKSSHQGNKISCSIEIFNLNFNLIFIYKIVAATWNEFKFIESESERGINGRKCKCDIVGLVNKQLLTLFI